ncbi:exodeoxyribonuclease V subunit alpha [Methylonatrum kenyense]|uniref:exodeoxyribonuclease V subunit alpha n=1 Tax=Methylonatrum kenyense TaxID=455253 RepID=UPI0020BE68E1|nr:exodeoxyribonuclease V subunit alpha [Methylonatrum kenyense]MCK8514969.1 exodeoxyribonuclease V subunit alpha [Methylonatrum kenyense]
MQPEALPRAPALPQRLQTWLTDGWLRATDLALAALLAEDGGEQDETVLLLAALVSHQVGGGHVRLDLRAAIDNPASLWPDLRNRTSDTETPLDWLASLDLDEVCSRLQQSAVVDEAETDGTAPLVLAGSQLYLRRYWANERLIDEALDARLQAPKRDLPGLRDSLDALFPPDDNGPDWQRIACALASRSRFTLITGGPGTGKTTTVVRLLGLLQSWQLDSHPDHPLRIRLAAPTGKAAARLGESIGGAVDALPLPETVRNAIPREVSTLHRLLGPKPQSRLFRHDRHNPLHADLVVVDEASMIDQELTARLLDALRPETTLILLGDKDQLASVEAGAVLGDLCQGADQGNYTRDTVDWVRGAAGDDISPWQADGTALQQHIVMLRKSHRFSADSGIGALAEAVRLGDQERANALLDSDDPSIGRITISQALDPKIETAALQGHRPYLEQIRKERPDTTDRTAIDAWARAALKRFADYQVLAVVRDGPLGVSGLNQRIARRLKAEGLTEKDHGWFEGRPVMVTRNDYELGLMNGDIGLCLNTRLTADEAPRLRVAFELPDRSIRLVLPSRLEAVDSVFAMTVHKSQGSEFGEVLLVLPETDTPLVSRELVYTAVTRAREGVKLTKFSKTAT